MRIRIGTHSGAGIAGNIGTLRREKYSVIADTVNVGARVERLNKELGTDTLMTEETLAPLPDALRHKVSPRAEHHIKGRTHAVVMYSI